MLLLIRRTLSCSNPKHAKPVNTSQLYKESKCMFMKVAGASLMLSTASHLVENKVSCPWSPAVIIHIKNVFTRSLEEQTAQCNRDVVTRWMKADRGPDCRIYSLSLKQMCSDHTFLVHYILSYFFTIITITNIITNLIIITNRRNKKRKTTWTMVSWQCSSHFSFSSLPTSKNPHLLFQA